MFLTNGICSTSLMPSIKICSILWLYQLSTSKYILLIPTAQKLCSCVYVILLITYHRCTQLDGFPFVVVQTSYAFFHESNNAAIIAVADFIDITRYYNDLKNRTPRQK
jgi:hypothetical protein